MRYGGRYGSVDTLSDPPASFFSVTLAKAHEREARRSNHWRTVGLSRTWTSSMLARRHLKCRTGDHEG